MLLANSQGLTGLLAWLDEEIEANRNSCLSLALGALMDPQPAKGALIALGRQKAYERLRDELLRLRRGKDND